MTTADVIADVTQKEVKEMVALSHNFYKNYLLMWIKKALLSSYQPFILASSFHEGSHFRFMKLVLFFNSKNKVVCDKTLIELFTKLICLSQFCLLNQLMSCP